MRPPRAPLLRAEDAAAGLFGTLVLFVVELTQLDAQGAWLSVAWPVAGLFGGLALLIGLGLSVGALLSRFTSRRWLASLLIALPALVVLIPAARTIFDGAFASTLPGARLGFIWVPVLGLVAIAAAVRYGSALARLRLGRWALGVILVVAGLALDLLNRSTARSEYPSLHTLVLVACCVLVGLGLRFFVESLDVTWFRWPWGAVGTRLAVARGATLALLLVALMLGLRDSDTRRVIADHGMHARMLDRAAKLIVDLDRDGFPAVLGGGDCNDLNGQIHPGGDETAGNGIDEDCDGQDGEAEAGEGAARVAASGQARAAKAAAATRAPAELDWLSSPEVTALRAKTSRMNVLLLVVDALRADPFSANADNRQRFPHIFALRKRSRWFHHAYSAAAGTDISMGGVLTGQFNPTGGVDLTMAEVLRAAGYRTHGVIPSEVLRAGNGPLLTRGFATHDTVVTDPEIAGVPRGLSSNKTTDRGLAFLDSWTKSPDGPFFLWMHYLDVHEHHQLSMQSPAVVAANEGRVPRDHFEQYRALVGVVDRAIGRVMAGLEARKLASNTIVVLMSDHGESLFEDPRLPDNHGRFLYNALVHVPLAIHVPGLPPGEVSQSVGLLDVPATLLDLSGTARAMSRLDGESLLPFLVDSAPPALVKPPRTLPLVESDQFGVIVWPYKLLVRPTANITELFDISRDPDEENDRSEALPGVVRSLRRAYRNFPPIKLDRTAANRRRWEQRAVATTPTPESLQRLAELLKSDDGGASWRAVVARDAARTGGGATLARTAAPPTPPRVPRGRVGYRPEEPVVRLEPMGRAGQLYPPSGDATQARGDGLRARRGGLRARADDLPFEIDATRARQGPRMPDNGRRRSNNLEFDGSQPPPPGL
jgi:arylsulfatase A-like enzyme